MDRGAAVNGDFRPPRRPDDTSDEMDPRGLWSLSDWLRRPVTDVVQLVRSGVIASAIEDRRAELRAFGYDVYEEQRKAIRETAGRVLEEQRAERTARLTGDPGACLRYINSRR